MFNATIKRFCIIAASVAMLASCADSDKAAAVALLDEAKAAREAGNNELAFRLADSVGKAYPRQIEVRREAMHIASLANEALITTRLEKADSMSVVLAARVDSLESLMKKVDNPIEPYFIAATATPEAVGSVTGLQARMSPEGDFYLVSTLKGRNALSTSVTLTAPDGTSATTASVAHDGERNDRSMGAEVITFIAAEADTVGRFVAAHPGEPMQLTFNGSKPYTTQLAAPAAEAIATVYLTSSTLRALRLASIEKEKLTRALDTARSQSARTYTTPAE